ncbi:MAG: DUF5666 domain-containing protein [Gemmatimonadota bacterium]|nr:DUF5666 domain-containing protein [Gemmatimonadota bacterium]
MNGRMTVAGMVLVLGLIAVGPVSCMAYQGEGFPPGEVRREDRRETGMSGRVVAVDSRRQEVRISTSDSSSPVTLLYDRRTRVESGSRGLSMDDLRRDDRVRVWTTGQGRERYVTRIEVVSRSESSDRRGSNSIGRVQRLDGTVGKIDIQRGTFEVRGSRGPAVVVVLPPDHTRLMDDQLRRLRKGQTVRVEGLYLENGRMQLRGFLQDGPRADSRMPRMY